MSNRTSQNFDLCSIKQTVTVVKKVAQAVVYIIYKWYKFLDLSWLNNNIIYMAGLHGNVTTKLAATEKQTVRTLY